MPTFSTDNEDYKRYGLDDKRCSRRRPTGHIELEIGPNEWVTTTEAKKWIFTRRTRWKFGPPFVRKLYDRFLLEFAHEDIFRPRLMLLVPYSTLTDAESKTLNELSEKRHPKNIDGEFYGVSDECLCFGACEPKEVAPHLVGYQEKPEGCFFIKQPETSEEYELAIQAVLMSLTDRLRYSGSNLEVLGRIRMATRNTDLDFCQGDLCDHPTDD